MAEKQQFLLAKEASEEQTNLALDAVIEGGSIGKTGGKDNRHLVWVKSTR